VTAEVAGGLTRPATSPRHHRYTSIAMSGDTLILIMLLAFVVTALGYRRLRCLRRGHDGSPPR